MKPLDKIIITQPFGARPEYYAQWGYKGHEGIDLKTKNLGTSQGFFSNLMGWQKAYAVCDGTVEVRYDKTGYGTHILLTGDEGRWLYAHLKNARCVTGQKVKAGDVIAVTGNTGNTQGAHLHLSYRPKDYDPQNGFKGNINPPMKFTMQISAVNTDPILLELATKKLQSYTNLLDFIIEYTTRPEIVPQGEILTQDECLPIIRPLPLPFVFLTYKRKIEPIYADAALIGDKYVVKAMEGVDVFHAAYELCHLLQKWYNEHRGSNPPIQVDDVFDPNEQFLKSKMEKVIPHLPYLATL